MKNRSKIFSIILLLLIVAAAVFSLYRRVGDYPLVPKSFENNVTGSVVVDNTIKYSLSDEHAASLVNVLSEYIANPIRYWPEGTHGAYGGMDSELKIILRPQDPKEMQAKTRVFYFGAKDGKCYAVGLGTRSQFNLINNGEELYVKIRGILTEWGYLNSK